MDSCDFMKENCQDPRTMQVNDSLRDLYETWLRQWNADSDCGEAYRQLRDNLTYPALLICTDAYFRANIRTIVYGQEAHDKKWKIEKNSPLQYYQTEDGFDYEKDIEQGNAVCTEYLKTRLSIAGISKENYQTPLRDEDKEKFRAVLSNNLNKTSLGGNHMFTRYNEKKPSAQLRKILGEIEVNGVPFNDFPEMLNKFQDCMYKPFEFNKMECSVFMHELRILKPKRIIFICGKSYNAHIIRGFGELGEKIAGLTVKLSTTKEPTYTEELNADEVTRYTHGALNKLIVTVAYHPNAHFSKDMRDKYNNDLNNPQLTS